MILGGGGKAEKSYLYAIDLAEAIYLVIKKVEMGKFIILVQTNLLQLRKLLKE